MGVCFGATYSMNIVPISLVFSVVCASGGGGSPDCRLISIFRGFILRSVTIWARSEVRW
jgi:hypothetical protein